MRIYNCDKNEVLDKVEIYLTLDEAEEFQSRLKLSLSIDYKDIVPDAGNVFGEEDGYNVTPSSFDFYVYTDDNVKYFSEASKNLILEDRS